MKNFYLTLMVILISSTVYIKQDPLLEGRYQLFDENWSRTGYIIQDKLCPDKFNVYDKDWRREGFILKKDADRWDFDKTD